MTWEIIILSFLSAALVWQFVGYPLAMGLVVLLSRPKQKDYSYQPSVTIVVPSYNEGKTIQRRLENLLALDYPKDRYDIIVVDSGSKDSTCQIVEKFAGNNRPGQPQVALLQEGMRKGKASAVAFAKSKARGEIIVVTDANCL